MIDVLAGWVMPLDVWYIIPALAFAPRCGIAVYPHREIEAGQYEPFREAWCLLACWKEGVSENGFLIDRPCRANGQSPRTVDADCNCGLKEVIARLQAQSPDQKSHRSR